MALIGNAFEDYVKNQIKIRQKALGQGLSSSDPRTLDTLKAFNANAPWIRLASAVSITGGNENISGLSVQEIVEQKGIFDGFDWKGDALSKNFVLMGAPTNNSGANRPSGVIDANNALLKAYGYGYVQADAAAGQGYIPPPGIVDASFEYKNDGALAFATINIKAFSAVQFNIIDILFQRPGYTCLLEFGHTIFLGNDGTIKRAGQDVDYNTSPFDFLYKAQGQDVNYTNLSKKIASEKQKWEGNYEGFFGRITKFNWKFNTDGSYDITVKLTGVGDVISSLKSNTPKYKDNIPKSYKTSTVLKSPTEKERESAAKEGGTVIADALESQLNFELYSIFADTATYPSTTNNSSNFGISDITMTQIPIGNEKKDITITKGVFKADVNDWGGTDYSPITSIKFGAFLCMLQKICNIKDSSGNHMLSFNMVEELASGDAKNDTTYIVTYPGNFSSNPTKALIKYFGFDKNIAPGSDNSGQKLNPKDWGKSKIQEFLYRTNNDENVESPDLAMRLSDVYVDIGFISNCLKDLRGSNSEATSEVEIPILDLINAILSGINTSLGGINNFRVMFNETTNQINIISESPILNTKSSSNEFSVINTFGLNVGEGSFVVGMDLNSELTDQFATQLAIGAQANSNTLNGGATSFSSYSKGLVDRMFAEKKSSIEEETTNSETETPEDQISKIFTEDVQEAFYQVYSDREFGDKYIPTLEGIVGNVSSIVINRYTQKGNSPVPFFLPFNLSLTMHGLGGMKIYQGFQIDGKGLPVSYDPKSIQLIIKSLSHTVNSDGWKTKISTLSKPLTDVSSTTTPENGGSSGGNGNSGDSGGSGGSGGASGGGSGTPPTNNDKLTGTFDQDVTATWNISTRKKIINAFGWPITVQERGGKFYGKKIAENGSRTVYEISRDYKSRNNKKFTYTFKSGRTITKTLHQGIHEPLKKTLDKIDAEGFADGIKNIDASIYARDTTNAPGVLSGHSFGVAMDFNSTVYGYGNAAYKNYEKDLKNPKSANYKAAKAIEIAKNTGLWNWGGNYSKTKDTHHFTFKPYSS